MRLTARRPSIVGLILLAAAACESGDVEMVMECGAGMPCPAGFSCDPLTGRCLQSIRLEADAGAPDARAAFDAAPDAARRNDAALAAALALLPASQDFGSVPIGDA